MRVLQIDREWGRQGRGQLHCEPCIADAIDDGQRNGVAGRSRVIGLGCSQPGPLKGNNIAADGLDRRMEYLRRQGISAGSSRCCLSL